MYQIKLSTSKNYDSWINFLVDRISEWVINNEGIFAESQMGARSCVCFAVPESNKHQLKKLLKSAIVELYIVHCKREYFKSYLDVTFCDIVSKRMLINTLTAFNYLAEKNYVECRIRLSGDFNLDGFYNFILKDIISEWRESAEMIFDNSELVEDEQSFNIMLKFLLSGIDARIKVVYLTQDGKGFILNNQNNTSVMRLYTEGQLLEKLAEIAPEKVVVCNQLNNERLLKKIEDIFCIKKKHCEKI